MGYYSRVRGSIRMSPGLDVDAVRANATLKPYEDRSNYLKDLRLYTFFGDVYDTIEGVTTEGYKAYDLKSNLEEIVAALPEQQFSGRLEIYGEEDGDIWGLRVKNGVVQEIKPELVWPED